MITYPLGCVQKLDEETRRIDQKNQQIVEMSDQLDNKNITISNLEADKWGFGTEAEEGSRQLRGAQE